MKLSSKIILLIVCMIAICFGIYAQDSIVIDTIVTPPGTPSGGISLPLLSEWFNSGFGPIIGVLTVIIGYYSEKIPILKNIGDTGLRIIAIGILIGGGYVAFGNDIWEAAASFLFAHVAYHGAARPATRAIKEAQE